MARLWGRLLFKLKKYIYIYIYLFFPPFRKRTQEVSQLPSSKLGRWFEKFKPSLILIRNKERTSLLVGGNNFDTWGNCYPIKKNSSAKINKKYWFFFWISIITSWSQPSKVYLTIWSNISPPPPVEGPIIPRRARWSSPTFHFQQVT